MTYDSTNFLLTYTAGGVTYTLNGYDATTGLTILYGGDSGWGMPAIQAIIDRGALQNGDTPIDYRYDARTISLNLFVEAYNYVDHLRVREKLSNIFRVSNTEGTLTITYSTTVGIATTTYSRSLDVLVRGGLQFGSFEYNDYNVDATVELRASDPMWYDPNIVTVQATQTVSGTPTPIPFLIPTTFGGTSISQVTSLAYTGTVIEYPKFTITAGTPSDISNLYIVNVTTNKSLLFTTLYAGRTYTIDLTYGNKTIIDDLGVNRIGLLGSGSSLATWAIDPSYGTNILAISSSVSNTNTTISMQYYIRYNVV